MHARRITFLALAAVLVATSVALVTPGNPTEAKPKAGETAFPTLAQAAAQPVGPGKNTNKPAAAIRGGKKQVSAEEVLPEGRRVNGCAPGYGNAGQCVPYFSRGKGRMNCGYLKRFFPDGILVTGRDSLNLDSNGDGLACGPRDKGVGNGRSNR